MVDSLVEKELMSSGMVDKAVEALPREYLEAKYDTQSYITIALYHMTSAITWQHAVRCPADSAWLEGQWTWLRQDKKSC